MLFSKKCNSGYKQVGKRCIKKNTKPKPETMCSLNGKTFCSNDKPLRPMIARAGGKSQIANTIIEKAPDHEVYVEPFVGGGAVFLRKPKAKKSVINDKDSDVMKVYKSFKNGDGFNKCDMRGSKIKYDRIKKKKDKSACDVAYLQKWSYAGKMDGNYVLGDNPKEKLKQYGKRYRPKEKDFGIKYQKSHKEDYKDKLKNTSVLNQSFEKVMQKNDSSKTFHYLDPPYDGTQGVYKEGKTLQPEEVCGVAKKMKGKVMISYNDSPRVRKACKGMKISKINTKYSRGANSNSKVAKEVLITNY